METSKPRRAYGSGSLTERNGDWYGAWRVNGKLRSRKVGAVRTRSLADGMTKAQAEARLRDMMGEATEAPTESQRRSGSYTITEVSEAFIEHAREHRGLKEHTTLADYRMHTRLHLEPFFKDMPVHKIDAELIEKFAAHLRRKTGQGRRGGRPLSPKTVKNYLGTLSALLNFSVKKKWIPSSPFAAVDLPTDRTDTPLDELSFLEPAEVARLVEAAQPGTYHVLDRALYTMATYTGLRQGELRGLRWQHVDLDRKVVHVLEGMTRGQRSSPKGRRRRLVPLAPPVIVALETLRTASPWDKPEDAVFATPSTGNPMARTDLMERYRKALAAASVSVEFDFHDLRHTFGTTMARKGVPVGTIQAWMGHADLGTTQIYMHYAPQDRDADLIGEAFA